MTTTTPKKAIVGRLPCGCIMAALIPGFDTPTNDKREIRRWTRDGLRIETTTIDAARSEPGFMACVHGDGRSVWCDEWDVDRVYAEATGDDAREAQA